MDEIDNIQALIEPCLRGDQAAYEAVYAYCAPMIYRLCYGLLMDKHEAEDVMQEAFVYAFQNLRRYDATRSAFRTWLYTIALSRCRNLYRRNRWSRFVNLFNLELAAPGFERPEAQLAKNDMRQQVQRAVAGLSDILREAVILRYGHGLTYREIAEVVDCPPKTAESRVRLAHERLRAALQDTRADWAAELTVLEWA